MKDAGSQGEWVGAGTTVLVGKLFRVRKGRGKRFEKELPKEPERRTARIALQLALAHRIQKKIEAGEIMDQAEAAGRLGLTRARLSQLLDLTLLAPETQERILFLEAGDGVGPLGEKALRGIVRLSSWVDQRAALAAEWPSSESQHT